ncbi:MAG TPA: co-chaperone DjlA [Polyangiaceae bacterium]|nr:co-chaperone DjlA [Polyangiaceae bacterium]
MALILILAFIGFWLAGPIGLLIGAAVGYLLAGAARSGMMQGLQGVQGVASQFLEATFSVMGALCKADGVVTRDEIRVTEQIFDRLGLSPEQRQAAKAAFSRGKAPDFDLDGAVDAFVMASRGATILYQLFLQIQLSAVSADGEVHPAEHEMLVRVARRLGLGEADVARLEALLRAAAGGAPSASSPPPQQRLDAAYAALGVTPEASESEIKSAYRKLMRDNHPDRLTAKGLPESMRALAEERAREINVAYDLIKKARNFS